MAWLKYNLNITIFSMRSFEVRELAAVFLRAQSDDSALAGKMKPNFMTDTCAGPYLFK